MTSENTLRDQLEAVLAEQNTSATRFGYIYFGDPAFVLKVRRGRKLRPNTERALKEALIAIKNSSTN